MKSILLLILTLHSYALFAVCNSPLSRTNVLSGSVLTSTKYNADFNAIYNRANNLPGDCILDDSVSTTKIANAAVTSAKIATSAITTEKIANQAVTKDKLSSFAYVVSPTLGSMTGSSTTFADVTNLSVSITTTGRPVWIGLVADASSGDGVGAVYGYNNNAGSFYGILKFLRGGVNVSLLNFMHTAGSTGGNGGLPPSSFHAIDFPAAGVYTYKVQYRVAISSQVLGINNVKLMAYEL